MHDDQVEIDDRVARELIALQFPQWARLPITRVAGHGTVNTIFRIGDGLAARFPLRSDAGDPLDSRLRAEAAALVELGEATAVAVPSPVAIGRPGSGYPLAWSVQTWLHGEIATPDATADAIPLAEDLVGVILDLRAADTGGRPFAGDGRGGNLRAHDSWMRECLEKADDPLDPRRLRALWARFRELPAPGALAMCHGDLTPPNLVLRDHRLAGVLDGGGFGPADPALDLVVAWHMFDGPARARLRSLVRSGDLEWLRGAAWAFEQAMGLTWYYRRSNPVMSALGRSTLLRILDDREL